MLSAFFDDPDSSLFFPSATTSTSICPGLKSAKAYLPTESAAPTSIFAPDNNKATHQHQLLYIKQHTSHSSSFLVSSASSSGEPAENPSSAQVSSSSSCQLSRGLETSDPVDMYRQLGDFSWSTTDRLPFCNQRRHQHQFTSLLQTTGFVDEGDAFPRDNVFRNQGKEELGSLCPAISGRLATSSLCLPHRSKIVTDFLQLGGGVALSGSYGGISATPFLQTMPGTKPSNKLRQSWMVNDAGGLFGSPGTTMGKSRSAGKMAIISNHHHHAVKTNFFMDCRTYRQPAGSINWRRALKGMYFRKESKGYPKILEHNFINDPVSISISE